MPSSGPLDAEIVFVADSPAARDIAAGVPFDGRSGKLFDMALRRAGLDRSRVRVMYAIPVAAPRDKFHEHAPQDVSWAVPRFLRELQQLTHAKVYVPLGTNALHAVAGASRTPITDWRGSILPVAALRRDKPLAREDYLPLLGFDPPAELSPRGIIVPTFAPGAVANQFDWHPLLINDLQRAAAAVREPSKATSHTLRTWHINDLDSVLALAELLNGDPTAHAGILAIDTENIKPPFVVGLATDTDVYVFDYDDKYYAPLQRIMQSPFVVKVAHNLNHDWTVLVKGIGLDAPALPWADTMGMSHALNNAMDKDLSPGIAARFTNWPYHKWLGDFDGVTYNGMDNIVTYDAYWPLVDALSAAGLLEVAQHDHALLPPLLDMQWRGFRVDETIRAESEQELFDKRVDLTADLQHAVHPIVDAKLSKFTKPHLFEVTRKCEHCGGGKSQAQHCYACHVEAHEPVCELGDCDGACKLTRTHAATHGFKNIKQLKESFPPCRVCGGTGRIQKRLPFNPNSDDQKADILYRGLGIRARSYKGKETVRVGQLESLADSQPLVRSLVDFARLDAEYDTVRRLHPASDGCLHCVFDPFGTDSGRVASKEGLIEVGTNSMNIPKLARRMVVPRDGFVFLNPDMAQVEARAIAAQTQDPQLMAMFNTPGLDAHMIVRDDMRSIGLTEFSRQQSKKLEFATFYGAKAKQLSIEMSDYAYQQKEGMPMTEEQTEMAIQYMLTHRFRAIGKWHQDTEQQLLEHRYVESITGRRRYWHSYLYDRRTKGVSNEILKQAYSAVPQDIGAWILALGLLELWKEFWDEMKHGLVHAHDALLFEVHESILDDAIPVVQKALTQVRWGMTFPAQIKVGKNWYEAS